MVSRHLLCLLTWDVPGGWNKQGIVDNCSGDGWWPLFTLWDQWEDRICAFALMPFQSVMSSGHLLKATPALRSVVVVAVACWEWLLLCGTVGTGRGMAEGGAMTVTVTPCLTTFAKEPLEGPGISWCLWVSIFAVKPLGGEKQSKEVISDGCSLLCEWKFP